MPPNLIINGNDKGKEREMNTPSTNMDELVAHVIAMDLEGGHATLKGSDSHSVMTGDKTQPKRVNSTSFVTEPDWALLFYSSEKGSSGRDPAVNGPIERLALPFIRSLKAPECSVEVSLQGHQVQAMGGYR